MPNPGLNIEGIEGLVGLLDKLHKNTNDAVKVATKKGARVILRHARELCPVADRDYHHQPGNLKKSLKIKVLKPVKTGHVVALIGPEVGKSAAHDGWYGRLVESGTAHSAPHPFLRPAYDESQSKAMEEAAKVLDDLLQEKPLQDFDDVADFVAGALGGGD